MSARKKIRIFYRAPGHVPIWKVMEFDLFVVDGWGVQVRKAGRVNTLLWLQNSNMAIHIPAERVPAGNIHAPRQRNDHNAWALAEVYLTNIDTMLSTYDLNAVKRRADAILSPTLRQFGLIPEVKPVSASKGTIDVQGGTLKEEDDAGSK